MRAETARRRFFLMAVLATAIGALSYVLVLVPQQEALGSKSEEIRSLRREAEAAAGFRISHPNPAQEAKMSAERKRALDALLPVKLDAGTFLAETEKQAAASGIALLGAAPEDAETTGGFATERLRLSVRGDFFALLDFLYVLEQQGRFVKIDAIRGTIEDGVLTGTLELRIYAREK